MVANNNEEFPLQSDGIFLSRQLSKKTSSSLSNNMGAASFRVYYGGENVNVPFMWESKPGTPKHNIVTPLDEGSTMPPLTPPPSYYTKIIPTKRSSSRSSNSFINSLAKFAPRIRPRLSSSSPSRSSSSSESSWKSISTYSPSRIFRKSRSILFDHGLDKEEIRSYFPTPSLCFGMKMQR
ncbi:hypothetical protein Droror1_Dr00013781 [Drosera rotundifolia]